MKPDAASSARVVPTVPRSLPRAVTASWTAAAVVACASAAPSVVSVGDERGEVGIGREQAVDRVRLAWAWLW